MENTSQYNFTVRYINILVARSVLTLPAKTANISYYYHFNNITFVHNKTLKTN